MFKLEFETDNEAFDSDIAKETAHILREIAECVSYADATKSTIIGRIRDRNGNRIGRYALTQEGDGACYGFQIWKNEEEETEEGQQDDGTEDVDSLKELHRITIDDPAEAATRKQCEEENYWKGIMNASIEAEAEAAHRARR